MRLRWNATRQETDGITRWAITAAGADEELASVETLEEAKNRIAIFARAALGTLTAAAEGAATWRSNLLPEGVETDERVVVGGEEWGSPRLIAEGACFWDSGPLPLMLQVENEGGGHYGAELCGSIDTLTREGNVIMAEGTFDGSDCGAQAVQVLTDRERFGISADSGQFEADFECVEEDEDGWCTSGVMRFDKMQIIGATMTPFPAFGDLSYIELVDADTSEQATADASLTPNEVPTFDASDPAFAGITVVRDPAPVVAAAIPVEPPAEWFEDPQFSELTPLTITDEGRVFGHFAPWGQCHIGHRGLCVTPPSSQSGYAHFATGYVRPEECDCEPIPTGVITMTTGHADTTLAARETVAHYDNSGVAMADVAAGEDAFSPWIAGALRPTVTPEQIRELRGSTLSGDWRQVGGSLELVALLAVNVPGFGIPRVKARVASGQTQALVAAGVEAMRRLQPQAPRASEIARRLERTENELASVRKLVAPLEIEAMRREIHADA